MLSRERDRRLLRNYNPASEQLCILSTRPLTGLIIIIHYLHNSNRAISCLYQTLSGPTLDDIPSYMNTWPEYLFFSRFYVKFWGQSMGVEAVEGQRVAQRVARKRGRSGRRVDETSGLRPRRYHFPSCYMPDFDTDNFANLDTN